MLQVTAIGCLTTEALSMFDLRRKCFLDSAHSKAWQPIPEYIAPWRNQISYSFAPSDCFLICLMGFCVDCWDLFKLWKFCIILVELKNKFWIGKYIAEYTMKRQMIYQWGSDNRSVMHFASIVGFTSIVGFYFDCWVLLWLFGFVWIVGICLDYGNSA